MYQIRLETLPEGELVTLRQRIAVWAEERGGFVPDSGENAQILYLKGLSDDSAKDLQAWKGIVDVCSEGDQGFRASEVLPEMVQAAGARFGAGSVSCIAGGSTLV